MKTNRSDFSNGYDAGNYDNAYVGEVLVERNLLGKSDGYRAGYVLGFFSSYETYEVPSDWADEVCSLREAYPEE